jgi:hypothetical protein
MNNTQFTIPTLESISMELKPLLLLLNEINGKVDGNLYPKNYYRNKDLRIKFGLSDNTITKYRDKNIIPFTKLGEVFIYPVNEIDKILEHNSNYNLFKSFIA